jgi:hypothetical protein
MEGGRYSKQYHKRGTTSLTDRQRAPLSRALGQLSPEARHYQGYKARLIAAAAAAAAAAVQF